MPFVNPVSTVSVAVAATSRVWSGAPPRVLYTRTRYPVIGARGSAYPGVQRTVARPSPGTMLST